jgi:hypothetical protein
VKKAKKQLLAAESEEDVQRLKQQLHVAEVDLNYSQYYPLAEPYVSLYPRKEQPEADEEDGGDDKPDGTGRLQDDSEKPKPPMWAEVEKRMEEGTLDELRNRNPTIPSKTSRPREKRPAQIQPASKLSTKPAPIVKVTPAIDMAGLNRRERRRLMRGEEAVPRTRTKTKSVSAGFEKNQAFGAEQAKSQQYRKQQDEDSDDGGFFE